MSTLIAQQVNLTGGDAVWIDRVTTIPFELQASGGGALNLSGIVSSLKCEIRTRDPEETLVATGTATNFSTGAGGTTFDLVFYDSDWEVNAEGRDQVGTHKYDVVGVQPNGDYIQLVYGRIDCRSSSTELP